MFRLIGGLINGILGGFLSFIGNIITIGILLVLFEPILTDLFITTVMTFMVLVLAVAWLLFDKSLRKKFGLTKQKQFSLLWTILSVLELSVLVVLAMVTILDLIPISVIVYDIVIYFILSILILSNKIKKLNNEPLMRLKR